MNEKPYEYNKYQEKWLHDLETTKAKQCKNLLREVDGGTPSYCCLGRAFEANGYKTNAHNAYEVWFFEELSPKLRDKLRLHSTTGGIIRENVGQEYKEEGRFYRSLAVMNDASSKTFKEIAEFIRANPRAVFKDQ